MAFKQMSLKKEFKRVKSGFGMSVQWETIGQELVGVYTKLEREVGANKSMIYTISNSNGEFSIWGGFSLDKAFAEIKRPSVVRIVFQGVVKTKGGGRKVKCFDVMSCELPEGFDITKDFLDVKEVDFSGGLEPESSNETPVVENGEDDAGNA